MNTSLSQSSTSRVRLHRDRKARGVVAVVQVAITEDLVRRLIEDGWITHEDDDEIRLSKGTISEALGDMLDDHAA